MSSLETLFQDKGLQLLHHPRDNTGNYVEFRDFCARVMQMPHMKDARAIYMRNHILVPQSLCEVTQGNPIFRSEKGHTYVLCQPDQPLLIEFGCMAGDTYSKCDVKVSVNGTDFGAFRIDMRRISSRAGYTLPFGMTLYRSALDIDTNLVFGSEKVPNGALVELTFTPLTQEKDDDLNHGYRSEDEGGVGALFLDNVTKDACCKCLKKGLYDDDACGWCEAKKQSLIFERKNGKCMDSATENDTTVFGETRRMFNGIKGKSRAKRVNGIPVRTLESIPGFNLLPTETGQCFVRVPALDKSKTETPVTLRFVLVSDPRLKK